MSKGKFYTGSLFNPNKDGGFDNRSQLKYCNGKPCYDKKGAVTAKNKRWHEDHINLRIYQCNLGDHWHLTSKI